MPTLVTGAAGFAGQHLVRELADNGYQPVAADREFSGPVFGAIDQVKADICDAAAVGSLVRSLKPETCVHLAAMTFVPAGDSDPSRMFTVNISGTLNLLESFRQHAPQARVLVVSTSHIYGHATEKEPLNEDAPLDPGSLYAVSKASADLTALAYARQHDMPVMTARPSNHTGPGQQPPFSVPSFALQVAGIAAGRLPARLNVGNLDSLRMFADVRDVVRAYRLLLDKGQPGRAYNIAPPSRLAMCELLTKLCDIAGISPDIVTDPARVRPADSVPLLDTSRIETDAQWRPEISLDQTLADILEAAAA